MTRIFDEKGEVVPITVIEAGPCFVTQVKSADKDGYNAVQLGFGTAKRANKPTRGHLKSVAPVRWMREVRTDDAGSYTLGQKLDAGLFKVGELVDVIGTSKGRGFAGVVKRYHFAGGPATHGQSDRERRTGAIATTNTPGWVIKGKRMPGHMGVERVTVQNLRVVMVDPERNLVAVRGGVPGAATAFVYIRKALKQ